MEKLVLEDFYFVCLNKENEEKLDVDSKKLLCSGRKLMDFKYKFFIV